MVEQHHLDNAPIREAIIDIQIERDQEIDSAQLQDLHQQFCDHFPEAQNIVEGSFGVQIDKGIPKSAAIDNKTVGFKYTSEDKKEIAQFRFNRFTFSRLSPYTDWDDFSYTARKLWDIYKQSCPSGEILRIATRYINVMRIPLPIGDFAEVLTAPPTIPDKLPQGLSSFLTRVVIQNPEIEALAIVTQAMEAPDENHVPITLDIDAIKAKKFDIESEEFWNDLAELRAFKNDIFFESITEKTAEIFE